MKYLCCAILFLASLINLSFADSVVVPSDSLANDVYYDNPDEHDNVYGYFVKRFDSYSVGTGNAYVYNDSGGTSSTAGAIKIRGMTNKVVLIQITNMSDSGTNTVGFFMGNGTTTPTLWTLISESVFNGTITSSGTQSGSVVLTQMYDYDRIGVKRSGTSAAEFTVYESYNREAN